MDPLPPDGRIIDPAELVSSMLERKKPHTALSKALRSKGIIGFSAEKATTTPTVPTGCSGCSS